jgi:hypothetical protein
MEELQLPSKLWFDYSSLVLPAVDFLAAALAMVQKMTMSIENENDAPGSEQCFDYSRQFA